MKSGDLLLNIRLCFYAVATLHLVFAAIIILPIDMSNDEDPRISAYIRVKWKLLTCWFNLMLLAYLPLSFYCDWKEKQGAWNEDRIKRLRKIRDYLMTSIIFPTTMYSDILFWIMWCKDPALIAPVAIFKYMPFWAQHSLHTVSGVTVILDIVLLPRRRPSNLKFSIALMLAFCNLYCTVVTISHLNGEPVYSLVQILGWCDLILFVILSYVKYLFFHSIQWHIIELVWGRQGKRSDEYSLDNKTH